MDQWNEDHFFTKGQKIYFLMCGIIVALSISYVTYLYWQYRVVNATWETTFVSPTEFWDEVPNYKWRKVFNDRD